MTHHDDRSPARADALRLEALLEEVIRRAPGEVEGVHGPGSQAWRVYREVALFLGGLRALLLQIAHPAVATGVDRHSQFRQDPVGRARRTFSLVYRITFGDLPTALEAARRIHARHGVVRGTVAAEDAAAGSAQGGAPYRANDPALLLWVLATLIDTARVVFTDLVAPLTRDESEQLYREDYRAAALFGIPAEILPPDLAAFERYFGEMLAGRELFVGPTARALGDALLARLPRPRWLAEGVQRYTASLLPEPLRRGFGLRFGAEEAQALARWKDAIRAFYARLPAAMRHLPAYHEAVARVARARGEPVPLASRLGQRLGWTAAQLVAFAEKHPRLLAALEADVRAERAASRPSLTWPSSPLVVDVRSGQRRGQR